MQPLAQSPSHWRVTPGVVLRERCYAPGATIERHVHAHATLIMVLDGAIEEVCGGRRVPRRPGELHLLPGGMPHSTAVDPSGARVFLVGLYDDWLRRSADRAFAVDRSAHTAVGTPPAQLVRRMYEEFTARDNAAALALEGLVLQTLGLLLRLRSRPPSDDFASWLTHVRDRLRDEFADPPSVAELAAGAGVSVGYLHRTFRDRFQCTPRDYVRGTRIEFVKHALRATSDPISRIAYAAGFSDQAHLTRCFRASVGMTPGAFRRLDDLRVTSDQRR